MRRCSLLAAAGVAVLVAGACRAQTIPDGSAPRTAAPASTVSRVPVASLARTWPAPDDRLTPGAVVPGCTYPRPPADRNVSTRTKHAAAVAYRYTGRAGIRYVEYDHRVPYALCGADTLPNIWPQRPEPGYTPSAFLHNRKDELEAVLASKVRYHRMTLGQAQAVFLGDWRIGWCTYIKHPAGAC